MNKVHVNPKHSDTRLSQKYTVRRSNGTIENDWKLREAHIASQYNIVVDSETDRVMVLYKLLRDGGEMTKAVPYSDFIQLNPEY